MTYVFKVIIHGLDMHFENTYINEIEYDTPNEALWSLLGQIQDDFTSLWETYSDGKEPYYNIEVRWENLDGEKIHAPLLEFGNYNYDGDKDIEIHLHVMGRRKSF